MKRMGNHGGSIGSQHQLGAASGSGQNLMSESYQQGEHRKAVASSFLTLSLQRREY